MSLVPGLRPVAYRDGYVEVEGLRLHYVDHGGDGEVVLVLQVYGP